MLSSCCLICLSKSGIAAAAAKTNCSAWRAGTTTKDIAKAAGISAALLYRHFSGKEERSALRRAGESLWQQGCRTIQLVARNQWIYIYEGYD